MNKKRLILLGSILLLVTATISFFAVIKPTSIVNDTTDSTSPKNSIKIAVVNEDNGTNYNGQKINMGATLLDSFVSKNNYSIETVSRAIAESGLENNTYQLMLVLPSKFSEDSLALESSAPDKAIFQYKIKSDKQLTTKQAEQAVSDFKSYLNKDLVNIYFLSIIGNLQKAQEQVTSVVDNEDKVVSSYNQFLVDPLTSYSQRFSGLGTSPSNLLSSFSSFNRELNNTNDAFTSIIDVNKTYDNEIKSIQSAQDAWQNSIDTREKNLTTYDDEFSKLSVEEQLAKINGINSHISDKLNEPEVWKNTTDKAAQFNKDIVRLVQRLKELNGQIDSTFANYDSKINTAIDDSLKNNISSSAGMEKTLGSYIQGLNQKMLNRVNAKWPTAYYDDAAINSLGLSDADSQQLRNVNAFMQWYSQQYGQSLPAPKGLTNQASYFNSVKQKISNELQAGKTLSFTGIKGKLSYIDMMVPAQYGLSVVNYPVTNLGNGHYRISLPSSEVGEFSLQYSLLANADQISVLEPVSVKAKLYTIEDVEVVKPGEVEESVKETVPNSNTSTTSTNTTTSTDSSTAAPTNTVVTKVIEKTIKNKTESKTIERTYSSETSLSIANAYHLGNGNQEFYNDVKSYLELSGIATAIFDINLANGTLTPNTIKMGSAALIGETDKADLKAIISRLIKESTINTLKADLKFSDEEIAQIEDHLVNSSELLSNIDGLRASTADLMAQITSLLAETNSVNQTIKAKPVFTDSEKRENTDLVTVSMNMNSDLSKLMNASQTLMDNTKSNQSIAGTIESSVEQLSNDVATLEKEGTSLSSRVSELKSIMSNDYDSNSEFLKSFSKVLSNTKNGNEKNTAVYEYLSNPVDATKINNLLEAKTQSTSQRQDERSGLLIIIISYLVALAIAYFLQHADIARLQECLNFYERIHWKNATPPMSFLTILGTIAGGIIGIVSGIKLGLTFGQSIMLSMILVMIVLLLTFGINFLLEKAKSFGFLVSIFLLMLYMVSATQLFDASYINSNQILSLISPLSYLETIIHNYINHQGGIIIGMLLVIACTIGLGVANGFIYRKISSERESKYEN